MAQGSPGAARGPAADAQLDGVPRGPFGDPAVADDWIIQAAAPWWVLHGQARNEKVIARELLEHNACFYLPLVDVRHTYAKSKVSFRVPLFPGYVFLSGGPSELETARRTNRVANILAVDDQPRLRQELTQIYCAVRTGKTIELYPKIQAGELCRITHGPLMGTEGVVIRNGHGCRMYLSVTMLGQCAVVEVEASCLERVTW